MTFLLGKILKFVLINTKNESIKIRDSNLKFFVYFLTVALNYYNSFQKQSDVSKYRKIFLKNFTKILIASVLFKNIALTRSNSKRLHKEC